MSETMPQFTVTNNSFFGLFMHPAGTHIYTRNSTSQAPPQYASHLTIDPATGDIGTKTDIATAFGFGLVITSASRVYFAELGGTFGAPQAGTVAGYVDAQAGAALPGSPYPTDGTNSLAQVLDPSGRFMALTNGGTHTHHGDANRFGRWLACARRGLPIFAGCRHGAWHGHFRPVRAIRVFDRRLDKLDLELRGRRRHWRASVAHRAPRRLGARCDVS